MVSAKPTSPVAQPSTGRKIHAIFAQLFKSGFWVAAVVLIGGLVATENSQAGVALMLLLGFLQFAWSYRKWWPMTFLTCMLPAVATGAATLTQAIQFAPLLDDPEFQFTVLFIAAFFGSLLGLGRGLWHRVETQSGRVWCKRQLFVLTLWFVSVAAAHGLMLQGMFEFVTPALAVSAFFNGLIAMSSIVLLIRYWLHRHRITVLKRASQPAF